MVAQDFLLDSQVRAWLDGVEPAWSLLTFESFQELRQEPSATRLLEMPYCLYHLSGIVRFWNE